MDGHGGAHWCPQIRSSPHFAASSLANFGFERTPEIMILVWFWFASPQMRRCKYHADLRTTTLAKFFRLVELRGAFSTPCGGTCMAALSAQKAIPGIDHLTFRAVLPKTRPAGSGRVNVRKTFRESHDARCFHL
jgi:hypothetical protein